MPYRLFHIEEAARYLHVSRDDLERLVKHGEVPFETQGGKPVFRKKDIDSWASQRILGLEEKGLRAYHQTSSRRMLDLSRTHAIMPDLIRPEFILPELHSRTRSSVLRDMVRLGEQTERVVDPRDLLQSLRDRETLCSTALPGGIALLHPRHHEPYMFTESFLVYGRAVQPVSFGAPDNRPSDLFFLLCCQDDRIHLHALARLCSMCHQTPLLSQLRTASDRHAAHTAILHAEEEVIRLL